jgi:hypothetical protein
MGALFFSTLTVSGLFACLGAEYTAIGDPNADGGSEGEGGTGSGTGSGSDAAGGADGGGGSTSDGAATNEDASASTKRRIFITTNTTTGKLPGLKGGDDFCKAAATQAGAGGLWVAFLSIPGANAIDRLLTDGPWYSMDRKTLIFTGKRNGTNPISGLGPAAAIKQNELGQDFTSPTSFWTGTKQGGTVSTDHCELWVNDNVNPFASGTVGTSHKLDRDWVGASTPYTCYSQMHIVCFEL